MAVFNSLRILASFSLMVLLQIFTNLIIMTNTKSIKSLFAILITLIVFASCKSNDKPETRNIQLLTDTSAYRSNSLSDTSTVTKANVIPNRTGNEKAIHSGTTHHSGSAGSGGTVSKGNNSSSNSGTVSNNGSSASQGTRKKGWSKAAQGAVIGGAVGAVGGAIISKNKGTGAIIGAAAGATGGYIIGRGKDKKDGRVKN
jgi:hypothetical protein